jgi:predicted dehydrogenase
VPHMRESVIRLGIIGCGAAAEFCHLPAARVLPEVKVVALADVNVARAKALGRRFGVNVCVADYHQFLGRVDGIIVALPNYLHAPVAAELLELGIPVLVEKPMALTLADAQNLVEAARAAKVALHVGHTYRFGRATRLVKRAVEEGWLGDLRSFALEYGVIFDWPTATGFFWKREQAGGGALIDKGVHMLDLLLWWLGDVVSFEYCDDARGGVEAECGLSLVLRTPEGATVRGSVLVSRLRRLGSYARIVGDRFTIECDLLGKLEARLWPSARGGEKISFSAGSNGSFRDSFNRMYVEELRAFAAAAAHGSPPEVSAESALSVMALIERCYIERKPLELPWMEPLLSPQGRPR